MAIPAGYVQIPTGTWIRSSDASGPYIFDGTNMTLFNGSVTTAANRQKLTAITSSTAQTMEIPAIAAPGVLDVVVGSGDTVRVRTSTTGAAGPWSTFGSYTASQLVSIPSDVRGIEVILTAGTSGASLVIYDPIRIQFTGHQLDYQVMAWSARDTPTTGAGTAIRCFTGTGAPAPGLMCIWTGSKWNVMSPTPIIAYNTVTAGAVQTAEQVIPGTAQSWNVIKAGLLGACSRFRTSFTPAKSGATDGMTIGRLKLGTANSTADTTLAGTATAAIATGDRTRSGVVHLYEVTAATQLRILFSSASSGGLLGASSSAAAGTTYTIADHTANDLYLTLDCSMAGTTDTAQLGTLSLVLEP